MNLPDTNVLPAPLWLITALQVVTLTLHFAAMNFLLGGIVLVCAGRFASRWENPTVRRLVALFPSAVAATVTLGVAPLLFLQLVYPTQVYSAAIVSGWFWLMIIPAVMTAYSLLYAASFAAKAAQGSVAQFLLPAVPALLYVSLVYSSVFSMAEHPDLIRRLYGLNQSDLHWNPKVSDYVLRWLHMVLGAITAGSFFAGAVGRNDSAAFPVAKKFFTYSMAAAAAAGLGYLLSLGDILPGLMHTPAIWALMAGILLSGGALRCIKMLSSHRAFPAPPFQGFCQLDPLYPGLTPWALLRHPFGVFAVVKCLALKGRDRTTQGVSPGLRCGDLKPS
jgi:hypothetical protein